MEYRSIKELLDAFCPDMEYRPVSGGNLRLSRCPFCGGKKAYINPKPSVNGFICYSGKCGKQLGFMSLYKELSGQNDAKYPDAVAFIDGNHSEAKSYEQALPEVHEETRASLAQRHKVYSKMLSLLTLDDEDKRSLLKRGLKEEQITKLGYKSCPTKEKIPEIVNALEQEGLNLSGVPGFYKRYGKNTMMLANGFFIPFRSLNGQIQGMQIRRKGDESIDVRQEIDFSDTVDYAIRVKNNNPYPLFLRIIDEIPSGAVVKNEKTTEGYVLEEPNHIQWEHYFQVDEEKEFTYSLHTSVLLEVKPKVVVKPRYIWFTSGNKNGGTPATNFVHFVGKLNEVMYLTEGALKADVTYCLTNRKKSFVAVPGISSIKDMPSVFSDFKNNGVKEISIVFDMDRIYNNHVMEAIEKVKKIAEDAGLSYTVPEWDISMGKGIDDFTLAFLLQKNDQEGKGM